MIVTVVGARPQFIKAAAVSKALQLAGIDEVIIHTGQHYDKNMSDVFWKELRIPKPTINLSIGSGTHGNQTGRMMIGIEEYILENVDSISGILLYGDTNSTLAGALVGSKLNQIPVYHVEAGLRSFNRRMPEEINRIITDQISSICFCPSSEAVKNLRDEGRNDGVYEVGDVMLDAMNLFSPYAMKPEGLELPQEFGLLTIHRPSNTHSANLLEKIVKTISENIDHLIWPVHPRCEMMLNEITIPQNVVIAKPFSYLEMLYVLDHCNLVCTDSGGLQKEAYWMKKRCITLREDTEWVETLHGNWNVLVGNDKAAIELGINKKVSSTWKELYGNGSAANKIANIILKDLDE